MKISPSTAPVWINANPSFKYFDGRIVRYLSCQVPIAYWEYSQDRDEASSMDIALTLLHDYLKSKSEPIDLIGHGTGGLLGLLYARKYPHRVKSLTLLGVGFNPANDWQTHYYQMRKLLPCSQEILLARIVQMMFWSSKSKKCPRFNQSSTERSLYCPYCSFSLSTRQSKLWRCIDANDDLW